MLINTCCNYESLIAYELCPECHEQCDWEVIDVVAEVDQVQKQLLKDRNER